MTASSEVVVTLSVDLFSRLRTRAAGLEVSLDWLVAGLVCDTIEAFGDGCRTRPASWDSTLLLHAVNGTRQRRCESSDRGEDRLPIRRAHARRQPREANPAARVVSPMRHQGGIPR
jgi:hypothetical protein